MPDQVIAPESLWLDEDGELTADEGKGVRLVCVKGCAVDPDVARRYNLLEKWGASEKSVPEGEKGKKKRRSPKV